MKLLTDALIDMNKNRICKALTALAIYVKPRMETEPALSQGHFSYGLEDTLFQEMHIDYPSSVSKMGAMFHLISFAAHLMSNNLLDALQIDKLVQCIHESGTKWVLDNIIDITKYTGELIASIVLTNVARLGLIETIRNLIAKGIDVNAASGHYHRTMALIEAVKHRHPAIVRLLLQQGWAVLRPWEGSEDALPRNAFEGFVESNMDELLMEYGADLNARRQGCRSLLVSAIYNRDLATAHILLHAGASVEGDPSTSALRASAEMSNTEMVKYIIAAGDGVGDDKKFDIWHRSD